MKRLLVILSFVLLVNTDSFAQVVGDVSAVNDSVSVLKQTIMTEIANGNDSVNHYLNDILDLYKTVSTKESKEYADCLMWCALICERLGDDKQAQSLMQTSQTIFEQYGDGPFDGKDTINEIFYLDYQSELSTKIGIDLDAVKYSQKSCDLKRDYFGQDSEIYLKSLLDLSRLYARRLNNRKSWRYHNLGYQSYVKMIKREFCEMSESERTMYWSSVKSYIDKTIDIAHISANGHHGNDQDSIACAAYNALLLSKGLLLNTTIEFENYVKQKGDSVAISNLLEKKRLYANGALQAKLDSLDYVILNELKSKGMGYNIPHLSIGWQDVRAALGDDDLAMEFYRNTEGEYGAILLRKDWKSPRIVYLKDYVFNGKSVKSLRKSLNDNPFGSFSKDDADNLWGLSKSIWTDEIVKYLPMTESGRVYFSADGDLMVTGIEYLPFIKPKFADDEVKEYYCMSDIYNVYRLSSTRQLVTDSADYNGGEAAVYGGLSYNVNTTETGAHDGLRTADDGILELYGTKIEADSIVSIINGSDELNLKAVAYTGADGTETSFKNLGGRGERVIHVGTHGFFYGVNDTLEIERFELGDNPLSRSGLLFAGADAKWFGDPIPNDSDDGFLTALEISAIDFRGLDLVVLSACETGKGEIDRDGVFGLQRGFKMASANSILMSLWKVDDDATCALMTAFYRNWTDGMTKHDALEAAKNTVRSQKQWHQPKYWAAFILIDAID